MTKTIHIGDTRSGAKCTETTPSTDILVNISELKQTVVYYESSTVEAAKAKFDMESKSLCTDCFPERFVSITEFR